MKISTRVTQNLRRIYAVYVGCVNQNCIYALYAVYAWGSLLMEKHLLCSAMSDLTKLACLENQLWVLRSWHFSEQSRGLNRKQLLNHTFLDTYAVIMEQSTGFPAGLALPAAPYAKPGSLNASKKWVWEAWGPERTLCRKKGEEKSCRALLMFGVGIPAGPCTGPTARCWTLPQRLSHWFSSPGAIVAKATDC